MLIMSKVVPIIFFTFIASAVFAGPVSLDVVNYHDRNDFATLRLNEDGTWYLICKDPQACPIALERVHFNLETKKANIYFVKMKGPYKLRIVTANTVQLRNRINAILNNDEIDTPSDFEVNDGNAFSLSDLQ